MKENKQVREYLQIFGMTAYAYVKVTEHAECIGPDKEKCSNDCV